MPTLVDSPVLAEVVRGGFVESVHHGLIVLTRPDGSVEWSLGEPDTPIFPRSCLKPVQALAMLRGGLRLTPPQIAIACASHSGEPMHLATVRSILTDAGLEESVLGNTPDWPMDQRLREAWIAAGLPPRSIAQCCSGKHAAMVAACRLHGWAVPSYLDQDHPCQVAVARALESFGAPIHAQAVDGCGAQAYSITIADLARVYGTLAAASRGLEREVARAMRGHPHLVAGTGRDATEVMRQIPGAIAKDGAEGVYAVGLADGRGIAVKVADGSERAQAVVLGGVLRKHGLGAETLWRRLADQPVMGHGHVVGVVRATSM